MMRNRIYFFTGTGNSLHAAQIIGHALTDCEIVPIHKDTPLEIPDGLDRLGFVFPSYASGPPNMVMQFMQNMILPHQNDTYLFIAPTYGGMKGSVLSLTGDILRKRGWKLNYGAAIRAYPNAVTLYPMVRGVKLFTGITARRSKRVGSDVAARKELPVSEADAKAEKSHANFMNGFKETDSKFRVSNACISCGICAGVCPADNITLNDDKPAFNHHCESCMACIQHCPKRAIDYADKTQKRRRYTNPDIGAQTIIQYYGKVNS